MINKKIRELYNEYGEENDVSFMFLENPSFDNSIIGHTEDNRLIYDYNKMIIELGNEYLENEDTYLGEEDNAYLDAEEFIQYNTLRAIPYFNSKELGAPIIMYSDLINSSKEEEE